jgi:hypothetical protein
MKKNHRLKIPYDLRRPFGDYNKHSNLAHYFKFYSADDASINAELENLSMPAGRKALGNNVTPLRSSPYNKTVKYSSSLVANNTSTSYYRIPWGGTDYGAYYNDGKKATIAMWISLENMGVGYPSTNNYLFNKVYAGTAAGSWASKGEMALIYSVLGTSDKGGRLSFHWNGYDINTEANYDISLQCPTFEKLSRGPFRNGDWIHFAFVIEEQTGWAGAEKKVSDVVSIYINGIKQSLPDSHVGGGNGSTPAHITNAWTPRQERGDILIARGKGDQDLVSDFTGNSSMNIYDLAIWDDSLSSAAIDSIWLTSQYFEGSGFLSLPPRVQIKREISTSPVYMNSLNTPVIKNKERPYNDASQVQCNTGSLKQLQYPLGIPTILNPATGKYEIPGDHLSGSLTLVSSSLASPNTLPDIIAPGYPNFNILNKYYAQSDISSGEPQQKPFNDSLVLPNYSGDFYGATTSIGGFGSKLRDKIQITIELPINEISTVTRHSAKWDSAATFPSLPGGEGNTDMINPHYDDEGEFQDEDLSGFLYYNKHRGVWEQKGLHYVDNLSPAANINNGLIPIDQVAQETKCQNLTIGQAATNSGRERELLGQPMMNSGSSNQMRLFYPGGITDGQGQYYAGGVDSDGLVLSDVDKQLAANVGHPMASNYAPNAIQYYATSSQLLEMKDYISEPFMLEKVILELPDTTARKIFDFGDNKDSPTCGRPQDDYVFFLMRQSRNYPGLNSDPRGVGGRAIPSYWDITGSLNDASSSMRYIICSGVAAFYNSERRVPGKLSSGVTSPWTPLNSPAFSFNFNSTINNTGQNVMTRLGPVTIPMSPAAPSRKILGNYILPTWDGTNNLYITQSVSDQYLYTSGGLFPATIQAFWPGGTSTLPLSGAQTGSRTDVVRAGLHLTTAPPNIYGYPTASEPPSKFNWAINSTDVSYNFRTFYEVNPYYLPLESTFDGKIIDSRTFKFFGAGASSTTIVDQSSAGLSGSWLAGQPDNFKVLNAPSPYVIFPEDNIILGLDAALGWTATLAAGITKNALNADNSTPVNQALVCGANNLTGSYLKINPGQPMKLRLFGSLIKNNESAPKYPASDITQPNITTSIIGSHVVDQWDISSIRENSGSYRERLFTGSMTFGIGPERTPNVSFLEQSPAKASPAFSFQGGTTANTSVITCSFGDGYDMWGSTGGTANPFYVRLVPSNIFSGNSFDAQMTTRATGHSGNSWIRHDEIYLESGWYSTTVLDAYTLGYALRYMIDGDPNNYYTRYGTSCGGNASYLTPGGAGIPGISAQQNAVTQVNVTATSLGAGGNTVLFSEGFGGITNVAAGASNHGSWDTQNTSNQPSSANAVVVPEVTQVLHGGSSDDKPFRELAATANNGNLGEFGSFNRFITIPCASEKYFDSAVPRIMDIWKILGREPLEVDLGDLLSGYFTSGTSYKALVFGICVGEYLISEPAQSPDGVIPITSPFSADWWGAFPFEPKFESIKYGDSETRVERMWGSQATTDAEGRTAAALYWLTDDTYRGWANGWSVSGSFGFDFQDLIGGPTATMGAQGAQYSNIEIGLALTMENQKYGEKPNLTELAHASLKLFYGIGDGVGNLIQSKPENYLFPTSETYEGDGTHIDAKGIYPPIYRVLRRAKKPRGWKYGLINAIPQNTQCVFRADHFGQFRDLLETRPYGMFTDNTAEGEANNGGPATRHVFVRFVQPLWVQDNQSELIDVRPVETRSGNLSNYVTSSLPYFDQQTLYPFGRDRPDSIPTLPPEGWTTPEVT